MLRDLEAMPERSASTAFTDSEGDRRALEPLPAAERVRMPPTRGIFTTLDGQRTQMLALVRQCAEAGFPRSLAVQLTDWVLHRPGGRLESYETSGSVRSDRASGSTTQHNEQRRAARRPARRYSRPGRRSAATASAPIFRPNASPCSLSNL